MKRVNFAHLRVCVILAAFLAAGCSDEGKGEEEMTKDDVRDMGKADWWDDFCELFGWYGDGVCDDFCPRPDPDCVEEARCGPIPDGGCDAGETCDIRSCAVGGTGVCVDTPGACTMIYDPVCGCDGETYGNDCERLMAGAALDHEGACEATPDQCGGFAGLLCAEGETCDIRMCAVDASGLCVPAPEACIEIYDPVCGCDGETYGNDCERLMAGAALDHEGACGGPEPNECGPFPDGACPEGQVCDIHFCGLGAGGVCVPAPDACAEIYAPVCGCDGETYGNDCERLMAGTALDHEGTCGGPEPTECGPFPDGFCPEGQVCDIHFCGLGAGGVCVTRPDACIMIYDPVCGCNGETYGNDCLRLMDGTALDHEGPC
jgi:hypothetical protein